MIPIERHRAICNILTQVTVLLSSVFYTLSGAAQTTISERLNYVLDTKDMDMDMDMGLAVYNDITESDLTNLPDSILFDYHYLGGYINSESTNPDY